MFKSFAVRQWVRDLLQCWNGKPRRTFRRRSARLHLEVLEDRVVPAALVVTTVSDALSHTGTSLRDAINQAVTDAENGQSDTISFSPSLNGTVAPTVTLVQGPLVVSGTGTGTITLDGGFYEVNGNNLSGDFQLGAGISVILSDLSITGGSASNGGAISNFGPLVVQQCDIFGNTATNAPAGGGAIYNNSGTLTVMESSLYDNSASLDGGGIYTTGGTGSATITNDSLSGNTAADGGGIYSNGAKLTVVNCTINANTTTNGGAIDSPFAAGTLNLTNDILAGNTMSFSGDLDNSCSTTNVNYTMIGNPANDGISGGTGNIINPASTGLGTFGNYHVGTENTPLLTGSPALGAGGAVSQLSAADSAGSTSISVANGTVFAASSLPLITGGGAYFLIQIDGERMAVTGLTMGVGGSATLTVVPGQQGTTAAAHSANASVYLVSDQIFLWAATATPPAVNMGSIQTSAALSFVSQPVGTSAGTTLSLFTVELLGAGGVPVANDLVTISISSGTLNGTSTALTNSSGIASFSTLSVPTAGTYTLLATSAGDSAAQSSSVIITAGTGTTTTFMVANANASGTGSLAAAVTSANADTTTSPVIEFDQTFFSTPQTITPGVQLTLTNTTEPVTIDGSAPAAITVSGGGTQGIFLVNAGVTASISFLSLTNGGAAGGSALYNKGTATVNNVTFTHNTGGLGAFFDALSATAAVTNCTFSDNTDSAVYADGSVTLQGSTISGDTTSGWGAGMYISGATVTIVNCTITGNSSGGVAGGIYAAWAIVPADVADDVTIIDSTLSGNTGAFSDAAIENSGGTMTLINSTVANNVSDGTGLGGIGNEVLNITGGPTCTPTLTVVNCTISGNSSGTAGGIFNGGTLNIANSVVAGNTAGTDPDIDSVGTIDANYTLVGKTPGANISGGIGNILGSANPGLGTLGNNGGPTQTIPLLAGSPAIGVGGDITTLNAAVSTATATTITVPNGLMFGGANLPTLTSGYYEIIQIDSEFLAVTGMTLGSGTTATLTVTRGFDGTTAATHAANAPIFIVADQRGFIVPENSSPKVDMGAVQSTATNPAGAAELIFTVQPTGANISPVVEAETAIGGPAAGVTITLTSTPGGLGGTTVVTTNASGLASFSNLTEPGPGTYTLTATSGSLSVSSSSFVVVGAAATLAYATQPASTTAGATINAVTVTADDSIGLPVPGTVITIAISAGTLNGTLTATTNAAGAAVFGNLSEDTAGTYTLSASTAGVTGVASNSFTISAGALANLAFTQSPNSTTAGSPLGTIIVTGTDQFGNPVSGAPITLSIPSGTLSGTTTGVTNASGQAQFTGLSIDQMGTYTMTAADGTLASATSSSFVISAGSAALSFLTQPLSTTAGTVLDAITVFAKDQFSNPVGGDAVTIGITSGTLGGTLIGTTNAAGQAIFSTLVEDIAGTYALTAVATGAASVNSSAFVISAGAASNVTFVTQPLNTTAGATINAVSVSVTDKFGNADAGAAVSVALSSGTFSGGTLTVSSGTTGVAVFSNLVENTVGTYTISASVAGTQGAGSNSFVILAATSTAKIALLTQPSSATAGATLSAVTAQVADKFGNAITGVAVNVALAPGTLSAGTTPITTNALGEAVFSDLVEDKAGTYSLTVSSSGLSSVSSSLFVISPAAGVPVFVTQPNSTTAGTILNAVTVRVADQSGNLITGAAVSLAISSGTLSTGSTLLTTSSSGIVVFNTLSEDVAGTYTLSAAIVGSAAVSSNAFVISPFTSSEKISFVSQPTGTTAGTVLNPITVELTDKFGNPILGAAVNIAGSPRALSAGTTPITTNSSGQAAFADLSEDIAGTYVLTASATGAAAVSSSSFVITPSVSSATLTFLSQPTNAAAGVTLNPITVLVSDQYGNAISGQAVNVAISAGSLSTGTTPLTTGLAGTVVFSDLSETVAGTYSLTMSSANLASVSSHAFTISALVGTTDKLSFVNEPNSTTAGTVLDPLTVQLADKYGNAVAGVAISLAGSPGKLSGTVTPVQTGISGQAVFSTLSENIVGTYSLIASSSLGMPSAASSSFTITAAAPAKLAFLSEPTTTLAGSTMKAITVQATDQYGNLVSGASVSIALSSASLAAGTTPLTTASNGQAVFSDLVIDAAGTYTLTASSSNVASASSNSFSITGTTAADLTFITQPTSTSAGSALGSITVKIGDQFGNAAIGVPVRISIASGTLAGVTSVSSNTSGMAVFNNLAINTSGTYTLIASATGLTSATSNAFVVSGLTATKLLFFTQPSAVAAGATMNAVTVEVTDKLGNGVGGVPVSIAISPGTLTTGTTPITTNASGFAVFSDLSETTLGQYSLVATATGLTAVTSNAFQVTAGTSAPTVSFVNQPSAVAAGTALAAVTLRVTDSFGNPIVGGTVTMGISAGALAGVTTVTSNANGLAIFTGLSIGTSGAYQLIAQDVTASATSNTFSVTSASTKISFASEPLGGSAGGTLSPVTVLVTDAAGDVLPGVNVAVKLAAGQLGGATTVSTNSAGEAIFASLSISTAGTYTLLASAPATPSVSSSSFVITSSGAARLSFLTQPTSGIAGGTLSTVTVLATDSRGNPVAGIVVSLSISSGTLSGATTAVTNSSGDAVFTGLSTTKSGSASLTASIGGQVTATSATFTILGAAPVSASFVSQPTNTTAGSTLSPITVQVVDQYGNGVAGASVRLAVSSGTLIGTTTLTTNAAGQAVFGSLSIDKSGTYALSASAAGLSQINSASFVIAASEATARLSFVNQPGNTAAGAVMSPVTLLMVDQYGNPIVGASVSIRLSTGTLSGSLTGVTNAAGEVVFSTLKVPSTIASGYELIATALNVSVTSNAFAIVS